MLECLFWLLILFWRLIVVVAAAAAEGPLLFASFLEDTIHTYTQAGDRMSLSVFFLLLLLLLLFLLFRLLWNTGASLSPHLRTRQSLLSPLPPSLPSSLPTSQSATDTLNTHPP